MARKVILDFDQHGNMKADAVGFVGTACEEATRNILGSMAGSTVADKPKPEMMQAEASVAQVAARW